MKSWNLGLAAICAATSVAAGDQPARSSSVAPIMQSFETLAWSALPERPGMLFAVLSGDPKTALSLFEKGIQAWPNNAGARYLAGLAARDLGDEERAIAELRESVRASGEETVILTALCGHGHFDMGAYRAFLDGGLENFDYPEEAVRQAMEKIPAVV